MENPYARLSGRVFMPHWTSDVRAFRCSMWHEHLVLPCTLNDNFDAAQPYLPQSSQSVCRALQRGEHFICAFRVLLRSMGMEQRVTIFSGDEDRCSSFEGYRDA